MIFVKIFNNELLIQFGRFETYASNLTIYLPVSYTTKNYSINVTMIGTTWFMERINTKDTSNFTVRFDYVSTSYLNYPHIFWIAVGY